MDTRTTRWKATRLAALGSAGLLLTAGCLSSNSGGGSSSGGSGNKSKTIEIMMAMTGPQATNFEGAVDPYAKSQGITIKWSPTPDFNTLIHTRVSGNQLPDIALFPQPGIMKEIAKTGKLADLTKVLNMSDLQQNYVPGELDAGKGDNGTQYAVTVSMNVKSLVFYPKQAFEAKYQAPKTLDDLISLTQKISKSGTPAWCMGIESAAATGWPATDWIEQLVLDYGGIQTYNDWVSHKVKFDSPTVQKAASTFAQLMFTPGQVAGGRKSIASANFNTAANPMFANPPGCYMYKQGNFVAQAGGFPANIISDLDNKVGVFQFPPAQAGTNPIEGGGDLAGLFSGNNDAAKKIMVYMTGKGFGQSAATAGTWMSPRKDFPLTSYPHKLWQQIAQIADSATVFAFDGSDQMPGEVGSGSFWRQMTSWISGQTSQSAALKAIDQSWPAG